jgi:hypothetical protein
VSPKERSRNRYNSSPATLLRLVDQADIADESTVQQLVTVAALTDNPQISQRIEQILAATAMRKQAQPFGDEPSRVSPLTSRIQIGNTITGSRYDLREDDLTKHLLTVGQSGAGKTTLFYNLMDQLTVPFWTFDLKQDYRHLIQDDEDLLILPWTEFRFNPLRPPEGVPPRRWAQVFSEMFGHATALLSGSKNYLMKQIIEIYRLYGLFDTVAAPYPSLHELQQLLATEKINYARKPAKYRDTVVNRLEAMTLTAGTVFDCSEGYPIEDLLERNIVFEFDGLGSDVQNFLMEMLFAYVYEYRLAQNQRGGGLRHVFFLDEGKRLFSAYKERQDAAGIPAIDQLTAKMREFGEGLVVADQEATKLTESIKANTYTKILLTTGDTAQFEAMTGSMTLSERQTTAAQKLGIGEAIVHTGDRDHCPVRLDNYELEKTISDADLYRAQNQQWDALSAAPRERADAFEQQVGEDTSSTAHPIPDDPPQQLDLSEAAGRLVHNIIEHPFKLLTERYEEFANDYQGNKAKNELIESGMAVERSLKAERGKLLKLTERGRDYAESTLKTDVEHQGRGGIVHRYWQHRLTDSFEAAGWPAKIELFDADVYVNTGEEELVVEVAMGNNPREIEHVKKHLKRGVDRILVACPNEEVQDGIRERLAENDLMQDQVTVRLFRDIGDGENTSL